MTERIKDHGTFAVSTNDAYNRLPNNLASNFRITNLSGKIVGVRNRHSVHVIEDFESGYDKWDNRGGSLVRMPGMDLAGANSAKLEGIVAKKLDTLYDDYIIKLSMHSLYGEVKVGIFDTLERVDLITAGNVGTTISFSSDGAISTSAPSTSSARWKEDTTYELSIEVHPSINKFTAELFDGDTTQVIAQGLASQNLSLGNQAFYLGIEATAAVLDEVLCYKKENYAHELVPNGSSYKFDCEKNINEYEIINLGSDARNFGDNTDSITLTGYYSK